MGKKRWERWRKSPSIQPPKKIDLKKVQRRRDADVDTLRDFGLSDQDIRSILGRS